MTPEWRDGDRFGSTRWRGLGAGASVGSCTAVTWCRRSGRQRPGSRRRRQASGSAVAQCLLEIGNRADDLVEGATLVARVGQPLPGEEPPGLVLMSPARGPALEQAIVDGGAHLRSIGSSLPAVECRAGDTTSATGTRAIRRRVRGERGARKRAPRPPDATPGGQAVSHLWGEESRRTACIYLTLQ